jgi:hypothetical protein
VAVAGQENAGEVQNRGLTNGIVTGAPNDEPVLAQYPETIVTVAGNSSVSSSSERWAIHYSQRPKSAGLVCGPISWDVLAQKVRLSDEVVSNLILSVNPIDRTNRSHR